MKFLFKSEVVDYDFIFNNHSETILFLHGWGGSKNSFENIKKFLINKFNLLNVTMPTIEPTNEVWDLFDYEKLIMQILSLHNIENPIIICHSFGFRVATILKEKIKIKKIIVTGGAGPKKSSILKKIEQQNNSIILKNSKFNFLYNSIASKDYKNLYKTNKTTFKNVVNFNTSTLLKFNCPILLFWGKHDKSTPIWIAKKIKKLNHCKLVLTDSDHFAYLKESVYFANQIGEFLK